MQPISVEAFDIIKMLRVKPSAWKGQPFKWAEVKYDGVRIMIHKDQKGKIKAYGKKWYIDIWEKISRHDKLRLAVMTMPNNSVIEGEAHNGKTNAEMATILAGWDDFEFVAFAAPLIDGNLTFSAPIEIIHKNLIHWGFTIPEVVTFIDRASIEDIQSIIVSRGVEGFVLKISHYRTWYKVKKHKEFDGIVSGIKPGKSKHEGKVGSLEVSVFSGDGQLIPVANVGSMTDEMRDRVTKLGDKVLGMVVEVHHDGFQKNRCRFPRFKRFRFDKQPTECTEDQVQ